jgi:hypothetical protein
LGNVSSGVEANTDDDPQWQALATASYVIGMMFIKLSICIFLLRLAVQKVYKYILWTSLVVITIWSVVLFFWDIFQCNPVEAQWDYTIANSRCVTSDQVISAAYSLSVMSILSDWLYVSQAVAALARGLCPLIWNHRLYSQFR